MIRCRFGGCPREAVYVCDHETMGTIMTCVECFDGYQKWGMFKLTMRRLRNKFMPRNRYRLMP